MIYFVIVMVALVSPFSSWAALMFPFFAGFQATSNRQALMQGFVSVFVVWLVFSYYFDGRGHGMISLRIAPVLHLPHPMLVFLIVSFLGGLLGMAVAWTGYRFRKMREGFS